MDSGLSFDITIVDQKNQTEGRSVRGMTGKERLLGAGIVALVVLFVCLLLPDKPSDTSEQAKGAAQVQKTTSVGGVNNQQGKEEKVVLASSNADQRSVTERDLNRFGLTLNNTIRVSAKKRGE